MFKLSNYNYVIPENNRYIYFNGISSQVMSLNANEHDRMQDLFNDIELFQQKYPSIFKRFQNWGYIIDQKTDEINILRYRNKMEVYGSKDYSLVLNPTLECNFNCWYCYEKHPGGHMNENMIERVKKHIEYMIKKKKITSLSLGWFGGEPMLYFEEVIYPISLFAKKLCKENNIPFYNSATTNASLITSLMLEKFKEIDLFGFQITLDGDQKRHDKIRNEKGKPSFYIIVSNVNMLLKELPLCEITLRINYDTFTLEKCDIKSVFNAIDKEYRKYVNIDFQRVWQTSKASKEEYGKRIQLYQDCIKLGFSQKSIANVFNVGWVYKCYVDRINFAEINYDGKVYRCTARDYLDDYVVGELREDGKIIWNELEMAKRYGKPTFENKMCLACKYLPLCMGPCSQKIIEKSEETIAEACYLNYCEVKPETVIVDYYYKKMDFLQNYKK